eukprot:8622571-Lingulodinium_polyedra.AAC.1
MRARLAGWQGNTAQLSQPTTTSHPRGEGSVVVSSCNTCWPPGVVPNCRKGQVSCATYWTSPRKRRSSPDPRRCIT